MSTPATQHPTPDTAGPERAWTLSDEIGANVVEGMSKGESAEALAYSMVGLTDTFDLMLEDIQNSAGESPVKKGYEKFRSENVASMRDLQEHGLKLSENVKDGASSVARNDYESSEEYSGAWTALNRHIND